MDGFLVSLRTDSEGGKPMARARASLPQRLRPVSGRPSHERFFALAMDRLLFVLLLQHVG